MKILRNTTTLLIAVVLAACDELPTTVAEVISPVLAREWFLNPTTKAITLSGETREGKPTVDTVTLVPCTPGPYTETIPLETYSQFVSENLPEKYQEIKDSIRVWLPEDTVPALLVGIAAEDTLIIKKVERYREYRTPITISEYKLINGAWVLQHSKVYYVRWRRRADDPPFNRACHSQGGGG